MVTKDVKGALEIFMRVVENLTWLRDALKNLQSTLLGVSVGVFLVGTTHPGCRNHCSVCCQQSWIQQREKAVGAAPRCVHFIFPSGCPFLSSLVSAVISHRYHTSYSSVFELRLVPDSPGSFHVLSLLFPLLEKKPGIKPFLSGQLNVLTYSWVYI